MMRFTCAIFGIAVSAMSLTAGIAPPIPRVILPAKALPKPEVDVAPIEGDDVRSVANRIVKGTKAVGEKLSGQDTSEETRKDQKQVADDIDTLIKLLENPPPMNNQNPPPPPMPNDGPPPPPPKNKGETKPQGGEGNRPRRPRPQAGKPNKPESGPMPMPMPGEGQPQGAKPEGKPMPEGQPMPMSGAEPGDKKSGAGAPMLPLAETIAKDFWGHLPEQPRQKMMQFFREQYVSKYKDLLPQYYSAISEKDKKAKK